MARPNVTVRWNAVVDDIRGEHEPKSVTHVWLKTVTTGALEEVETDGVFVAIGHAPATELVRGHSSSSRTATSRRSRTRRRPASRACSPRATSPTTSIGRR